MEEDYKSLGMEKEYMQDVVIYNLNKFIEYCNTPHYFEYTHDFKQHKEVAGYLETLIKGYRKLERTVKIKNGDIEWMQRKINNHYIDKSKVKEKIEPVIDRLEKDGFVGYADEIRDVISELMEDK